MSVCVCAGVCVVSCMCPPACVFRLSVYVVPVSVTGSLILFCYASRSNQWRMSDPNSTAETTHYWKSHSPISPGTQAEAEDKLNEVLAGDVSVSVHGVLWEAPTAVLPEAAVDSVHDLADLDEDDTTYHCIN